MKITDENVLAKVRAAFTNGVYWDPAALVAEQAEAVKRAPKPEVPPREATSRELQTFHEAMTDTQPVASSADLAALRAALSR